MKVLLLEDEFLLSRSIRTYLLNSGYFVDHYDNGKDVLDIIKTTRHDFYILDINTPLVGGLECLKEIAKLYPEAPKIVISAYHDIEYITEAYSFGCSDYLKKPFNLKELEIRIDHLTSKVPVALDAIIDPIIKLSKHYKFNKETNLLYCDDVVQKFTKRENALIILFVSNLGQIISDENIRSFIWNGEYAEDATIRSLVNRVRHKLKEELIENIRGFGYIMNKKSHD